MAVLGCFISENWWILPAETGPELRIPGDVLGTVPKSDRSGIDEGLAFEG